MMRDEHALTVVGRLTVFSADGEQEPPTLANGMAPVATDRELSV